MSPRDRDQQKRDGEKRDLGQQVEGRRAVRELLVAGRRRVNEIWLSGDIEEIEALADDTHTRCGGFRPISWNGVRAPTRRRAWWRSRRRSSPPTSTRCSPIPGLPRRARRRHRPPEPRRGDAHGRDRRCHRHRVPRHRAVGLTPAVAKAAAGALEYLPVAFVSGIPGVLERPHARACGASGSTPTATRRSSRCRRRPTARARPRCRRPRPVAARSLALRSRRVDPHAREHRVAQRECRRGDRVHRDRGQRAK